MSISFQKTPVKSLDISSFLHVVGKSGSYFCNAGLKRIGMLRGLFLPIFLIIEHNF